MAWVWQWRDGGVALCHCNSRRDSLIDWHCAQFNTDFEKCFRETFDLSNKMILLRIILLKPISKGSVTNNNSTSINLSQVIISMQIILLYLVVSIDWWLLEKAHGIVKTVIQSSYKQRKNKNLVTVNDFIGFLHEILCDKVKM